MLDDDGEPIKVSALNIDPNYYVTYPKTYEGVNTSLEQIARRIGADALVNVTYVPPLPETRFRSKPLTMPAFGYAVKIHAEEEA